MPESLELLEYKEKLLKELALRRDHKLRMMVDADRNTLPDLQVEIHGYDEAMKDVKEIRVTI